MLKLLFLIIYFILINLTVISCGCVNCTGRKQHYSPPRREEQPLLHSQRRLGQSLSNLGQSLSNLGQSSSNLGQSLSNPGQSSSNLGQQIEEEEDIEEFINNRRIVKIPLINYQTFEIIRDFKIKVYDQRHIYSYRAVNVTFAKFRYDPDDQLILMEILLKDEYIANNALEIFIDLTILKDQNYYNFNRIITMRGHKIIGKNEEKTQRMLLEGGDKTLEEYFLNMDDRSPSIMKNILYQMALTVQQFLTFGLHLNINSSNFICDIDDNNECFIKIIPGVNSIKYSNNKYNKHLHLEYVINKYKSKKENKLIKINEYEISKESDVYSLCLVAFEYVLRSANSQEFLLLNSHFTPENVEFLVGNLYAKTNYYHFRRLIDDNNEQWIWTNYLIGTIKYCLMNRPNIDYLIKQWGPISPPQSTDFLPKLDENYVTEHYSNVLK